jgi:AcrR family transcriptional regulator
MSETSLSGRPLRADARRNRERIVEAARELFAECGRDAQMDDLAARAGVGVGTVYRHFPTKEAVMAELLRQRFASFADNAREALEDPDGEPFEVFAALLRRNAELMARDAATRHALTGMGQTVWGPAAGERERLLGITAELIARAQRAGAMRTDVTASDLPMLMCGLSATMGSGGAAFDWRRHLEMLLDALRAPGAPRPSA